MAFLSARSIYTFYEQASRKAFFFFFYGRRASPQRGNSHVQREARKCQITPSKKTKLSTSTVIILFPAVRWCDEEGDRPLLKPKASHQVSLKEAIASKIRSTKLLSQEQAIRLDRLDPNTYIHIRPAGNTWVLQSPPHPHKSSS